MGQAEREEVVVRWKSCPPHAYTRSGRMTSGKDQETSPESVLYGQSTLRFRAPRQHILEFVIVVQQCALKR
jgi:hypothetical protein